MIENAVNVLIHCHLHNQSRCCFPVTESTADLNPVCQRKIIA